jgi:choline dehydrogenase
MFFLAYYYIILWICGLSDGSSNPPIYSQSTSFGVLGVNATFDYVIVGGGTAGLVVAKRLSESANITVAVVEAGTFYEMTNGNLSVVPFYATSNTSNTEALVDWGVQTIHQPQLNNRQIAIPQGKCLGGSSGRNFLFYHRATIGSYQAWADKVDDQNYTWENMLPYFKRSIAFTAPDEKRAPNATAGYNLSAFAPNGGPLHVSFPNYALPFSSWGREGFRGIGINEAEDFSSGVLNGSQYMPYTLNPADGIRSSSESSFLNEALQNSSLTVYVMTQAMKILFQGALATGVAVVSQGQNYTLNARKEVIISAGVFHSPQLLMVSGIGPPATLAKFNIPVISSLIGVGQNMKDSCNIGGITYPINVISMDIINQNTSLRAEAITQYLQNQSSIISNAGGDYVAWEKLPEPYRKQLSNSTLQELATFPDDWPELEYILNSSGLGLTDVKSAATITILLVAALSRGNVTISSGSMTQKPVISTNWLLEKADQELAVQAMKRIRGIQKHITGVLSGPELYPGSNIITDEQILDSIRQHTSAVHHGTSTCAMGRAGDPMAVVNTQGQVFGVLGLRIIDASSFPFTPPGHIQAAIYAHAEKLVHDIIQAEMN